MLVIAIPLIRPLTCRAETPFRAVVTVHAKRIEAAQLTPLVASLNRSIRQLGIVPLNREIRGEIEAKVDRMLERPTVFGRLGSASLTGRYGVDAILDVALKIDTDRNEGYCLTSAAASLKGYDNAGRDLGVGGTYRLRLSRNDCETSVSETLAQLGTTMGEELTDNNLLLGRLNALQQLMLIRLEGVTDEETTAAFGKVVSATHGVVSLREVDSQIIPGTPQASHALYQVKIRGTEPARLVANIRATINKVCSGSGEKDLRGISFNLTPATRRHLYALRCRTQTGGEIIYVHDSHRYRTANDGG